MREFHEKMMEELLNARKQHGDMNSIHEGLAVIWEEFEEFKEEVFRKNVNWKNLEAELLSVATMCQRLYEDIVMEKVNEMKPVQRFMSKEEVLKTIKDGGEIKENL